MSLRDAISLARKRVRGAARFSAELLPRMLSESIRNVEPTDRGVADLRGAADLELGASWLGHAGVLLRQGGMTMLVDPVLSHRIGPRIAGRTIGPSRLSPVPVSADRLPPVDLVLITHAHYDHLDKPTLERLAGSGTTVVTARRTRRLIPRGYARVIETHWDDVIEIGGARISVLRPAHWGGRTVVDAARGCNSYLIETDRWRTLAPGDTASTEEFASLGDVDLGAFGIGAYEPSEHHHATPEQVWAMFTSMPGRWLLPIHHSTFELSAEHADEPLRRLLDAARDDRDRVLVRRPGELWAPGGDGC